MFPKGIGQMARINVFKGLESFKADKGFQKCQACVCGKKNRLPFPQQSETRTKDLLDLVHTDVCGPMSAPSKGGAKYFVTFIDDFPRWIVVSSMKLKSEAFHYFKGFHKYAESHTGCKIQSLSTSMPKKSKLLDRMVVVSICHTN